VTTPDGAVAVPLVGLTGGLGAGKSTALAALERLGAAVLSTDAVVHELYDSDEVRDAVRDRWGSEVAPDGAVDRDAVARCAFASEDERRWLEGLLWPRVGARVADWIAEVRGRSEPPRAGVIETPLLFEAGMDGLYDATIAIIAPEPVRHERAAGRGHAQVSEREARQLSQEEKARRATYAVSNDGSVAELEEKLSTILDKLPR
jgi:dephospho-CoA kinase